MNFFFCHTSCKALLIDNDIEFTKTLCDYLEPRGCALSLAHSGLQARRLLAEEDFDIVLLDMWLPDASGIDLLRNYRQHSCKPIITFTPKSSEIDRIRCLEAGADDCLSKPLCPHELHARIQAILRRMNINSEKKLLPWLTVGSLAHNPATGKTVLEDKEIMLTGAEQRVLEVLMRSAGLMVTRQVIAGHALGRVPGLYDRSIDTHISCLRKKLSLEANKGLIMIRNLRGRGYLLTCS